MNPPSPPPTPSGRVTIDIDVDAGVDASRGVKKRFWGIRRGSETGNHVTQLMFVSLYTLDNSCSYAEC
jgi:hypothetical protein